jgi:3-deoxy-7-phosphoheptulonate synthase
MRQTEDLHVKNLHPIIAPEDLKQVFPATQKSMDVVTKSRNRVTEIINRRDKSLVAVVGPCSIHDPKAAIDYATRLAALAEKVNDRILVIMRVYFEKPRTIMGWKGLVSDPDLDGTHRISKGLGIARSLMCEITEMGLPVGTETLSPINPQYLADLISWGGIGARTSQSQTHREMVSGLSFPVGYKNPTSGDISIALDSMRASQHSHSFLGINHDGRIAIVETGGNPDVHLVLRGSDQGPNFSAEHILDASKKLKEAGLPPGIVIDCSHGNSYKNHERQEEALDSALTQIEKGEENISGFMLESFIEAGNQPIADDFSKMTYGQSVTDKCIDWATTERLLLDAYERLK